MFMTLLISCVALDKSLYLSGPGGDDDDEDDAYNDDGDDVQD